MLFLISVLLLFIEATFEKAAGAMILLMFNMVLCILVGYVFTAVDIYGYDTTGAVVHNVYYGMHSLSWLYVTLFYINLMLMVYCGYLFIQKPWEQVMDGEYEEHYNRTEF
jgi:hypothetical protein